MPPVTPSIARTVAKYCAISGASQSSGGLGPLALAGRKAGSPCDVFQSLQIAFRRSSMKVVDGIPAARLVASATGIRSVSGENLNRFLVGLLDWSAGRESPSRAVVSNVP